MDKLIELLNKYYFEIGRKAIIERYDDYDNGKYGTFRGIEIEESDYPYAILWGIELISKKFRFIKRLVDNDKIDLDKLDEKAERKPLYSFTDDDGRLGFKLFEVYESLLMLLSIQKNPIEFLVSILR